jgi:hypothetical protein
MLTLIYADIPHSFLGIFLASLIALATGMVGVLHSMMNRESVSQEATRNVGSLIVFVLLSNAVILGTLSCPYLDSRPV